MIPRPSPSFGGEGFSTSSIEVPWRIRAKFAWGCGTSQDSASLRIVSDRPGVVFFSTNLSDSLHWFSSPHSGLLESGSLRQAGLWARLRHSTNPIGHRMRSRGHGRSPSHSQHGPCPRVKGFAGVAGLVSQFRPRWPFTLHRTSHIGLAPIKFSSGQTCSKFGQGSAGVIGDRAGSSAHDPAESWVFFEHALASLRYFRMIGTGLFEAEDSLI